MRRILWWALLLLACRPTAARQQDPERETMSKYLQAIQRGE